MWKRSISHFYFIFILRFINCCKCDITMSDVIHTQFEKRDLEFEDFSTTEFVVDNITDTPTSFDSSPLPTTMAELNDTYMELNEVRETNNSIPEFYDSSTEVNGTMLDGNDYSYDVNDSSIIKVNETTTEEPEVKTTKKIQFTDRDLKKKCRRFKNGAPFDIASMADIWQVAYYRLANNLKCFKLHIKVVKSKEQKRLAKTYGTFNNTVHWDQCSLEIKSSDIAEGVGRRHFLQGTQNQKGIMDNIIIDEENCQNTTYLTLHRESADQWLVIKNLLVMRDCDSGELVVFSRVPTDPRRDDILDALMVFGENEANGTMACQEKSEKRWIKYDESAISLPLT